MKNNVVVILIFICIQLNVSGQKNVRTTIANGNFLYPTTWDCNCTPADTDQLIINHKVVLNSDWMANNKITINSSGSLRKDATVRHFVMNKDTLINNGVFEVDQILTNLNSEIRNFDSVIVHQTWLNYGRLINKSVFSGIDSLLNIGSFENDGLFYASYYTNSGYYTNQLHQYTTYFLNNGNNPSNYHTEAAHISNFGSMVIDSVMHASADMWNAGYLESHYYNSSEIRVDVDFLNSDSTYSNFVHHGYLWVGGNFTNDDTISGNGSICIHLWSWQTSTGALVGTLNYCDATTNGGLDINQGYIAPTVTHCALPCSFDSVDELSKDKIWVYPNPFMDELSFSIPENIALLEIYDLLGHKVFSQWIKDNSTLHPSLENGAYIYRIKGNHSNYSGKIICEH